MGWLSDTLDSVFGEDSDDIAEANNKGAITQSQKFYDEFLKQFIEPAESKQNMLWDVALGFASDQPGIINKGFDRAGLGISRMHQAGQTDILDQGENLAADLGQIYATSGLYGSDAHGGALQGATTGTQRALGQLSALIGGQSAGLETSRAGMLAGANQNLSSMYAGRAGHDLNFLNSKLNASLQAPYFADSGGPAPWAMGGAKMLGSFASGAGLV